MEIFGINIMMNNKEMQMRLRIIGVRCVDSTGVTQEYISWRAKIAREDFHQALKKGYTQIEYILAEEV